MQKERTSPQTINANESGSPLSIFLKAFGTPSKSERGQNGGFETIHMGDIKKLPPHGCENYKPRIKKERYIDSSRSLEDASNIMHVGHDLEDK